MSAFSAMAKPRHALIHPQRIFAGRGRSAGGTRARSRISWSSGRTVGYEGGCSISSGSPGLSAEEQEATSNGVLFRAATRHSDGDRTAGRDSPGVVLVINSTTASSFSVQPATPNIGRSGEVLSDSVSTNEVFAGRRNIGHRFRGQVDRPVLAVVRERPHICRRCSAETLLLTSFLSNVRVPVVRSAIKMSAAPRPIDRSMRYGVKSDTSARVGFRESARRSRRMTCRGRRACSTTHATPPAGCVADPPPHSASGRAMTMGDRSSARHPRRACHSGQRRSSATTAGPPRPPRPLGVFAGQSATPTMII